MGKVTLQQLDDYLRDKIEVSAFKSVCLTSNGKLIAASSVIDIGIPEYNADTDTLIAYVGGLILTETLDYTIDKVNKTLVKVAGDDGTQWEINAYYDIIVLKNIRVIESGDYIDGGVITAGSIKRTSIDTAFQSDLDAISAKGIPYGGVTTNSGNVYSLAAPAITALTDGLPISVKCNADSTGAVTFNWNSKGAKPVLRPNGSPVTNWKTNGIYTMRYNLSNTSFIQQGEGGSGNATASDLLSGKTASTDAGDIVGTMPQYGGVTGAATWSNPTASNKIDVSIDAGYWKPSSVLQLQDVDLVAGNIKVGVNIYGVTGTFTADANAVDVQLISGATAYVNGNKITGTMKIHNSEQNTHTASTNIAGTTTAGRLYLMPEQGYYTGNSAWTYYDDPNFVATNILSGRSIFGLAGSIPVRTNTDTGGSYPVSSYDSIYDGQVYTRPPAGYYDGNVWVLRSIPNLTAANIKAGVTIGAGTGGVITGTLPDGSTRPQVASGSLQCDINGNFTVSGLAFQPQYIYVTSPNYQFFSGVYTVTFNNYGSSVGVSPGITAINSNGFTAKVSNYGVANCTWKAWSA